MARWLAVTLGCVTALGFQALLHALLPRLGVADPAAPLPVYAVLFAALVPAGFVTGHLSGRWHAFNGALAAAAYIVVVASLTAIREALAVRASGILSLAPIDYVGLALGDLVALSGASVGGWLSSLGATPAPPPRLDRRG